MDQTQAINLRGLFQPYMGKESFYQTNAFCFIFDE